MNKLRRLFVLLGSLNSQNNNPNILREFTALLDALYNDKKITKTLYKMLYYKSKNLLESNMRKLNDTSLNHEGTA